MERVGVVLVHGIGEQRRFEHIDWQVRDIVSGLSARPGAKVTVDVVGAPAAPFQSDHDTWVTGPTVRVTVRDAQAGKDVVIEFHEVWWADVNEPYSLIKQMRFWWWGLTVWLYPAKPASTLPGANAVQPPQVPGRTPLQAWLNVAWVRARLFGVAFVAVVGAASIGILTFFAERVLNLRPPRLVRTFVNYVAGVKLYNQHHRFGIGFPAKRQDFLDTIDEPPRVSVRRRMIRALMDMAEANYARWYVFGHSLGSVVAFNGLMETAYAWPGYLDGERWNALRMGTRVGDAPAGWNPPPPPTVPRRPVWAGPREVAYRSRIFEHFHGLLTFGSPLEKLPRSGPPASPSRWNRHSAQGPPGSTSTTPSIRSPAC